MKRTYIAAPVLCCIALLATGISAFGAGTLCIEAESATGVTDPMRTISATNAPLADAEIAAKASGHSYLEVPEKAGTPPDVTNGQATVSFSLSKTATYTLWCRAWWNDQCGNSVTMSIDDGTDFTFGQDATYECWHWVKSPPRLKQLKLEAGDHTLTIKNREDGIRIDQILFSSSTRFVPVDIEKPGKN